MVSIHPQHCGGFAPYARRELEQVFRAASPEQRRRGRCWYDTARDMMSQLAAETGYTLEQTVAVLAITSPGAQLTSNLQWTRAALESAGSAKVGRFPNQIGPKVRAVLASPELAHEYVTGPKVGAFHRAILGDRDALVIDRWATAAANPFRDDTLTDPGRRAIDTAYRSLARSLRIKVRDLQAIVWIQVRETTPDARGRVRQLQDITA